MVNFISNCDQTLETGCTDPEASNFSSDALIDDGSCLLSVGLEELVNSIKIYPNPAKTTIAVNLALTQAIKEKCLLLDADMGMANAHILLGVNPDITVREVIEGKSSLEQAIVKAPNDLKFLSGGSGITELLSIDSKKKFNFIQE